MTKDEKIAYENQKKRFTDSNFTFELVQESDKTNLNNKVVDVYNSKSNRYFRVVETGNIILLKNQNEVFILNESGEWFCFQEAFSIFVDGSIDLLEINLDEVEKEIDQRKKNSKFKM